MNGIYSTNPESFKNAFNLPPPPQTSQRPSFPLYPANDMSVFYHSMLDYQQYPVDMYSSYALPSQYRFTHLPLIHNKNTAAKTISTSQMSKKSKTDNTKEKDSADQSLALEDMIKIEACETSSLLNLSTNASVISPNADKKYVCSFPVSLLFC
jgi:hypothetical protein